MTALGPQRASGAHPSRHKPRLGFLGVGWIGRHRLERVAATGLADIVAIADPSPESVGRALDAIPQAATDVRVGATLDDLLAEEIDGIVIATPSAMHADQAIAALEHGVAVFCQKPLARTAQETERVVQAAARANRLLGVDFSYRYTDGMQRIRSLVAGGELGDVYAVNLVFHNAYGPDKPWFYDAQLSGGGCVIDLGIHLVDLALWTLGFPDVTGTTSRLYARGAAVRDCASVVEDFASVQLELSTNAVVQLACSWNVPAGCDAVIGATFYGTKGGAALRNQNGSFHDFIAERYDGTRREVLSEPPDAWGARAAIDWVARLSRGETTDPETPRLVDVARTLDHVYGR
jgi:predicted dehydrogenase